METLNLSDNTLANSDKFAYQKLQRIIGFQLDRYTGMQTFTLPLIAQPLGHSLYPNCNLIVIMQEDRTWTALLTLSFQVNGRMLFPPPGETVYWLINNQRATSYVIDSNGQTVSTNFRVGTDVMPGPLFLWVSAPVTFARTSGWVSLLLPENLLKSLCSIGYADFRVSGMEFRLMGHSHANNGRPNSLGDYISGLRGFVTQRYDSPETFALRFIVDNLEKEEQKQQKRSQMILWAFLGFVLLFLGSCVFVASLLPSGKTNQDSIAIPSPTPTETVPAKKEKGRRG